MSFFRGDFSAGNAFFWSDLDLRMYAGTDFGLTPYSILLTDATGRIADGFIGAMGLGESAPTELCTDPNFSDPSLWTTPAGWSISGGKGRATNLAIPLAISQATILGVPSGKLYKLSFTIESISSGSFAARLPVTATGSVKTAAGEYSEYLIAGTPTSAGIIGSQGASGIIGSFSCKRVIEPPVTGVHIVSAIGGTVRSWAAKDALFNPNMIVSAAISMVLGSTDVVLISTITNAAALISTIARSAALASAIAASVALTSTIED